MFKTRIQYLAVIVCLLVASGCEDDFIGRAPVYSIDSENYFNAEADYQNALIAAYDLLQPTYLNVMLGEIASDNTLAGGESATDVIGIQQIDDMTHTPVNAQLKAIWDWMFAGVNRAAYVLEFKDKTDFDGRDEVIAQARFLKAYYNFELVKWFGPIPLKGDQRFALGDETSLPRASVEEVYASIESDLMQAFPSLPPPGETQTGRVTRYAALALLGKVYVYQGKYAEALEPLQTIIDFNGYRLPEDFAGIFEMTGENGPGSIFEVQYTDAEGAGFGCLQCSEGNVAVGFNGIRNHTGPVYDSGFSFNVPTEEAYNAYAPGDTRRDVAILDINAWADETGASFGIGNEHTGYYNRKYIARKGDSNIGDQNLTNPNNYRAIRYADVLLFAAEAYNATGNDELARTYLNQVRRRAFGDEDHDINASGAALGDFIQAERRLEFLGEGHRFFDLVRTGAAAGAIEGFEAGKHDVFPIPFEEIQFSNGNWDQNPGY